MSFDCRSSTVDEARVVMWPTATIFSSVDITIFLVKFVRRDVLDTTIRAGGEQEDTDYKVSSLFGLFKYDVFILYPPPRESIIDIRAFAE